MATFSSVQSHLIPLLADDVDTDQIIPARFLKVTTKEGLGDKLFSDWRYLPSGENNPEFILNHADLQDAQILLAGNNFGCGSSREHAPWALVAWGIRVVIALSFADIFRNNALKNGLIPVVVDAETHAKLIALAQDQSHPKVTVDLNSQALQLPDRSHHTFPVDSFARHCLLNGIDELGYILSMEEQIKHYEARCQTG